MNKLEEALHKILNIKNKMYGADWQEIDEAREIAAEALGVEVPENVFEEEQEWVGSDPQEYDSASEQEEFEERNVFSFADYTVNARH
jgi:hypothetical protein